MNAIIGSPKLRWPTTPVAGQSLPGLLVAAAGENGHCNVNTIRMFAAIEGAQMHGVEQLACELRLTRVNHVAVLAIKSGLQITRGSYEKLKTALLDGAGVIEPGQAVPLRRVLLLVGGKEKQWAGIFGAMLDGSLRYSVAPSAKRIVDRISVAVGPALDAVLDTAFNRTDHQHFPFSTVMRQRDAIELLNIDPTRYQEIAPMIPKDALGPGKTLLVDGITNFAERVIDQREAKARWGVKLNRSGMLPHGIGWDRASVERDHGTGRRPAQGRLDL